MILSAQNCSKLWFTTTTSWNIRWKILYFNSLKFTKSQTFPTKELGKIWIFTTLKRNDYIWSTVHAFIKLIINVNGLFVAVVWICSKEKNKVSTWLSLSTQKSCKKYLSTYIIFYIRGLNNIVGIWYKIRYWMYHLVLFTMLQSWFIPFSFQYRQNCIFKTKLCHMIFVKGISIFEPL